MLAGYGGKLNILRVMRKTHYSKVRAMHGEDRSRAFGYRLGVVPCIGPVSRAHFDQDGAALAQHVGNTKAAADLNRLPARYEHLAAGTEASQNQQNGRGVVVD